MRWPRRRKQGDTGRARDWYERAAETGDSTAMYNLGVLLEAQGDSEGARAWYQRAADVSHPDAGPDAGPDPDPDANLSSQVHEQGDATEEARA
ncbi:tetratricopeptide repeat protein [Streptomyces sp. NPDC058246]